MRTSLNEIKQIEDYLSGRMVTSDMTLFEASLVTNKSLKQKVDWQRQTYDLVKSYGRRKLGAEISMVEDKVFTDRKFTRFQKSVLQIFK